MVEFWKQYGITLVDQKFEFGLDNDLNIMLGDEITPDTQRLWNKDGESLDKDVFREGDDLDEVHSVYQYIYDLISKETEMTDGC
jgi:phosphoribosylaminoimidazole-succinocarboxamide synthase